MIVEKPSYVVVDGRAATQRTLRGSLNPRALRVETLTFTDTGTVNVRVADVATYVDEIDVDEARVRELVARYVLRRRTAR